MPSSHGPQGLADIFTAPRSHIGFRTYKNGRLPVQGWLRYINITSSVLLVEDTTNRVKKNLRKTISEKN
jgi:hypothetical protein